MAEQEEEEEEEEDENKRIRPPERARGQKTRRQAGKLKSSVFARDRTGDLLCVRQM